jgi:hypothetical protein
MRAPSGSKQWFGSYMIKINEQLLNFICKQTHPVRAALFAFALSK